MAIFYGEPVPKEFRNLMCGADRSDEFHRGHRTALRAAIAYLHEEADRMNDPKARHALNSTAFGLGAALTWQKKSIDPGRDKLLAAIRRNP